MAISSFGLGMVGSIVLHPDFGVDKTNQLIRKLHKWSSRATLLVAWLTAIGGLMQLAPNSPGVIGLYAIPLLAFVPFSLL